MQMKVKPIALALMLSLGATGTMVETAQAGVGKKVIGAVIVGGVAHHYWKKHERKKREERIREEQRRQDYQQMQRNRYQYEQQYQYQQAPRHSHAY